jgi:TfoX/Sxy family transcriptional regulator of competence genes
MFAHQQQGSKNITLRFRISINPKSSLMAYNEKLADRVREIIALSHKNVEEKKMFGGLCFMVNDKMCVGVETSRLMVRLDPDKFDEVMEKEGCSPMDFTGRVMKGFVFVDIEALGTKKKLEYWIDLALEYNKVAKASKKKKR